MSRPFERKTAVAGPVSGPSGAAEPSAAMSMSKSLLPKEFQAALDGSACLGAWSYATPDDRLSLDDALTGLLDLAPEVGELDLARFLSGIHPEDRPRIESTLYAAIESGGWFEAEFRTRSGSAGMRWLRLMGRCEREPATGVARTEGLAFDLTEGRLPPGTPAQRAQRQVNQLADHVIAMQGLVASLGNPPLAKAVQDVAIEVGFELARLLRAAESGSQH